MPVAVDHQISGKTETGISVRLDPNTSLEQIDFITVICDYADCRGKNNAPTIIKWNSEQLKEDPNGLPKEAQKILKLMRFDNTAYVFCSRRCLIHFLENEQEKEENRFKINGLSPVKR